MALACCSMAGSSLKNVSRARRSSSVGRSRAQLVGDVRLLARGTATATRQRLARALEVVEARLGEHLLELGGALDGVLDGAVARVERRDGVVLRAPEDGLHLAEGAVEHRAARQAVRRERRERGRDGVLVARDLLAQLGDDGAGVQLPHLAAEGVAEGLGGLHQLLELDALLRAERRLPEQVVVRERVARLDAGDRVDRLALAGRLDLPGAQEREDEQAHDLEVPAERLLRELVGEVAAARGVAVVRALLDAVEDLLQRAALDAEDGLALLVAQEAEAAEHRRQALEVLGGEEGVGALLHVGRLGGGLLEAVEDLGQHLAEHLGGGLADVDGAVAGAAVVAPEVDAAREAGAAQQAAQLVAVAAQANAAPRR